MRRYADPVEVRRGPVSSGTAGAGAGGAEGPEQFLWRGRLWKVRAVLAHWVETGPWWQSVVARSAVGADDPGGHGEPGAAPERVPLGDLVSERELWRVEAGRDRPRSQTVASAASAGSASPRDEPDVGVSGVFELSFDWAEGSWTLVGCAD